MAETIFALSSGGLPSGVSVIRISGPKTRFVIETMSGPLGKARHARLLSIRDRSGNLIDKGLVLSFPAPHSFTGEDCAELQVHGGRAVIECCLAALGEFDGMRQAEAGEFTRRAFENGKFDLTEVEGLADLIAAETEIQRRAALEQAGGGLRALYEGWMSQLTHARAMLEAEMDFSDEGDVPGSVADSIWDGLLELHDRMSSHLKNFEWGEIVRDGFRVALTGAPNVGKSSLINKLSDRDVAIVSSIPGTTRDSLEVRLSIGGYLVLLSDTAGLRSSSDEIEMEGMRRAHRAIQSADLVLHLIDGNITADEPDISPGERGKVVRVGTKSDLNPDYGEVEPELRLSVLTGEGLDDLVSRIKLEIGHMNAGGVNALPNRERYRVQINECLHELSLARDVRDEGPEIVAEHLRRAARSLGKITGHVGVEDLLGVIFSEFCVGK